MAGLANDGAPQGGTAQSRPASRSAPAPPNSSSVNSLFLFPSSPCAQIEAFEFRLSRSDAEVILYISQFIKVT